MYITDPLETLIRASISRIEEAKIDVYSYSFYFDHESKRRISICIDTNNNSKEAVSKSNKFTEKYFTKYLQEGDYDYVNFSANSGRNYSLGDFKYANMVSFEYENDLDYSGPYILRVIKTVVSHQDEVTKFSTNPEEVLFSCSTKDDEYGISWFKINPSNSA
jgi:hypothetical protein